MRRWDVVTWCDHTRLRGPHLLHFGGSQPTQNPMLVHSSHLVVAGHDAMHEASELLCDALRQGLPELRSTFGYLNAGIHMRPAESVGWDSFLRGLAARAPQTTKAIRKVEKKA